MSTQVKVIHRVDNAIGKKVLATLAVVEEWPEGDPRYDLLLGGASMAWLLGNGYQVGPLGWYKDIRTGTSTARWYAYPTDDVFETTDTNPPPPPDPEPGE